MQKIDADSDHFEAEKENAFELDSETVDGNVPETFPTSSRVQVTPGGHGTRKGKDSQPKGEGISGQKRICPDANGANKNYTVHQLERVSIRLFLVPQVLIKTFSIYFYFHKKYNGVVFVMGDTFARLRGRSKRTISDHLTKLCKLTAPGLPPLMQRRRGDNRRWYTESPFLDTIYRYALDNDIQLENLKEDKLLALIEKIFANYSSFPLTAFPASHPIEKQETIQEPIPQNDPPIQKALPININKQQRTDPVPVCVPSMPSCIEPEPVVVSFEEKKEKIQEEKEHTLIVSEKLYADSLFSENKEVKGWIETMRLKFSTVVKHAIAHKLGVKDLGNLLKYVYERWIKGLIKRGPMAYILGTIPNYTPAPEVPDYPAEAAKKVVQETSKIWEQESVRKMRTAYLEERLASDPTYERCKKIADSHFASLAMLVEVWQDETQHPTEIPDAKVLEHLLETALLENLNPLLFANTFSSILKNYCPCKEMN